MANLLSVLSLPTLPRAVLAPPCGHAHLVGIAGSGMRSLAAVLEGVGWRITGSDASADPSLPKRWRVVAGHSVDNLFSMPELVVHSPAIADDNPELAAARRLGIPIVSYPAMLGRLMADRLGIAVVGTHGKSTTVAMVSSILIAAGLDPTVIAGAEGLDRQPLSRHGRGRAIVVEGCEYRSSFLNLRPKLAAILGIEPDHFDYFRSPEHMELEFATFADLLPQQGVLITRDDCVATQRATHGCCVRKETFGFDPAATWQAQIDSRDYGQYRFQISLSRKRLGVARLQVPGRHNVLNALAAAALAYHAGASTSAITEGLEFFMGLKRRLELVGRIGGLTIVDDYAHHPTEVAATLAAVRQMYPNSRICCVFEPHQASRTKSLLDELAASLQNADTLAVADVFRAREPAWQLGDVTASDLAARARQFGATVAAVHSMTDIETWLFESWQRGTLATGDVLVTLGAGKIGKLAHGIHQRIRKSCAAE